MEIKTKYDAIMVGGGVMGCSTAYYLLKNDPQIKVAIIEKDPTYEFNSSVLSDANIRIQFNIIENIQISQYGLEVLETFPEDMAVDGDKPDIAFRRQGNLFISDKAGKPSALKGVETQLSLGCAVEWLSPSQINARFPLYETGSLAGGAFSLSDGTMDANALLLAYKNKAVALGADFIADEVLEVIKRGAGVGGVVLSSGEQLEAAFVVNSSGAWTGRITQSAGFNLPVCC